MSAPAAVARFDPPLAGPAFGNGLGLLLHEQRRMRRADPHQLRGRAFSPFASLRRRAQTAAVLR